MKRISAQTFWFVAVGLLAPGLAIAPLAQAQESVIPASVGGVLPAASNAGGRAPSMGGCLFEPRHPGDKERRR